MKKLASFVAVAALASLAAQAIHKHPGRPAALALSAIERQILRDAPNSPDTGLPANGDVKTLVGSLKGEAASAPGVPGAAVQPQAAGAGASGAANAEIEVVQSVPVETALDVPGTRRTQEVWVEMINAARKTIDLEQFYVYSKPGEALEPVLAALRAAAARGVQVRLLLDGKFYRTYPEEPDRLAGVPNIQARTVDFAEGIQHAKYFVVDRSLVFSGSANFDWVALTHIHEVGLRTSDAQAASSLEAVFAQDWARGSAIGQKPAPAAAEPANADGPAPGLSGLQVVASPPAQNPAGVSDTLGAITRLLGSARSSVKIQVYQYTTTLYHSSQHWNVLDAALRQAAARGTHVQLLVDKIALKTGGPDLKALASLANVEVRTVQIPAWSGGQIPYSRLIHSKYLLADDSTAWVGSENWSGDYFTNSRNVGVILKEPAAVGKLGQIFDRVWNSPYATAL